MSDIDDRGYAFDAWALADLIRELTDPDPVARAEFDRTARVLARAAAGVLVRPDDRVKHQALHAALDAFTEAAGVLDECR